MNYEDLLKLPSGVDDIEALFTTGRGSTYAHHNDATTTRNRSGANHLTDKSTGVQSRSGKTVFMNPKDVNSLAGIYQNAEMATKLEPVIKDGKPTGRVNLVLTEDYGPRKAGTILAEAAYTTRPAVGMNPVEIWGSNSPKGSGGSNIHFGNAITEVHPRPARLGAAAGKAGIAAALYGAAAAAKAGDYSTAADRATDVLALPFAESHTTNEGEQQDLDTRWQQAGVAPYQRKSMQPAYKAGGAIKMPDNYSSGSWKLI